MIDVISTEFERGARPENPGVPKVALEAGVDQGEAETMIAAAWRQIEAYTKRTYFPTISGTVVLRVTGPELFLWPSYPFPASLNVEVFIRGTWIAHSETFNHGMIELEGPLTYRLTQPDPITPPTPGPHVTKAVFNLATYQLVHSPARREFASQSAGDSSLSREHLKGAFYGSGAGVLLASEVRL